MARLGVWVLGGATLVAGAGVMAWFLGVQGNGPAPDPVGLPSLAVAPTPAPTPPLGAPQAPAAEAEHAVLPAFDVVRVARDGASLVAGTAEPGAAVTVRVDGAVVAEVAADPAGQFVAMFSLGASEVAQMMTLESAGDEGVLALAEDMVMLTPRPAETSVEGAVTAALTGEAASSGAVGAPAEVATGAAPTEAVLPVTDAAEGAEAPAAEPGAPGAANDVAEAANGAVADVPEPVAEGEAATPSIAVPQAPTAPEPPQTAPVEAAPVQAAPALGTGEASVEVAAAESDSAPTDPVPTELAARVPDGTDAGTAAGGGGGADTLQAGVETADPGPTALLIQRDGGVRVLDRGPSVMDNVVIDTISYSDQGDVLIAGRASRLSDPARLRIYLNNQPIAVAVATGGDWESDLPDVDPGIYTLRVDQVNDAGRVVSRFETPFLRESPQAVAAARARIEGQGAPSIPAEPTRIDTEPVPQVEPVSQAPAEAVVEVAALPVEPSVPDQPAAAGGAEQQALAETGQGAQAQVGTGQDAARDPQVPDAPAMADPGPGATTQPEPTQIASAQPTQAQPTQAQPSQDQSTQAQTQPVPTAQVEPSAETPAQVPALNVAPASAEPQSAPVAPVTTPPEPTPVAQARPDSAPVSPPEPAPVASAEPAAAAGSQGQISQGETAQSAAAQGEGTSIQTAPTQTAQTQAAPTVSAPAAPRATLITVQPGHTLWAISRERYGQGDRYMVIVRANRGQIRNPDLIYPGQVFALPED